MEDHSKNSYQIDLVVITISFDTITCKIIQQALAILKNRGINADITLTYCDGDIPDSEFVINAIKLKKKNPAFARNRAVKLCKNETIVFLDDDTLVNEEWGSEVEQFCISTWLDAVFFNSHDLCHTFTSSEIQNNFYYKGDCAGCIIKRSVFTSGLFFDESLPRMEDCDFVTRLIQNRFLVKFSEVYIENLMSITKFSEFRKRILNFYSLRLFLYKHTRIKTSKSSDFLSPKKLFTLAHFKAAEFFQKNKCNHIKPIYTYFFKDKNKLEAIGHTLYISADNLIIKRNDQIDVYSNFTINQIRNMRIIKEVQKTY